MSNLSGSFCCLELNINIRDHSYLTSFQVDGITRQQKVFKTDLQLVDWINTLPHLAESDLYVRLLSDGPQQKQAALVLAQKLSRPGLLIGLARQRSVCRSKTSRYNVKMENPFKMH